MEGTGPCVLSFLIVFAVWLALSLGFFCVCHADSGYGKIPIAEQIVLNKAYKIVQQNDFAGALTVLEDFKIKREKKEKPVHPMIWFTMGNYYFQAGSLKKAVLSYEKAVSEAPEFSDAWLNLAQTCYSLENYLKAGKAFVNGYESGEEKDPKFLYYSASACFSAKACDRALDIFKRLLRDHAHEIEVSWYEILVHIYLSLEQPENALPHMELLVRQSTGSRKAQWQNTLLYQYMDLGMDDRALALITELTATHPEEPKWWKGLVHFSLADNDYETALAALTLCSYLTPLSDDEKKLMAELNQAAGIPQKAAEYFIDLFQRRKSVDLLKNIITACQQMNELETAFKFADKGLTLFKDKADTRDWVQLKMIKAELLFAMKNYSKAAEIFQEIAAKKGRNQGRAWLLLGYSAMNMGDDKRADHALKNALKFEQQKEAAQSALGKG
ncbi:MAG: tetratricopeptide repeat protein [Thermodesulfobacteriota bacterium]|nr:tetratricopeptide repeat protein [Thermodesulfobacteriota bacterium]